VLTPSPAGLGQAAIQARQILRKLLVGRLIVEHVQDGDGRSYMIRGQASHAHPLAGVRSLVPPG
jgi:hypothetical protein